ncbi:MAG: DEAD/DEAH box helicase [Patescibacteria group bacterium]
MHYNSQGRSAGGQRPFAQSQGRGQFRRAPAGNRFGGRGGGRPRTDHIDVTKFINKATITESVERFVPEHAFTDFAIDERLKRAIVTKGYTAPTPIQDRVIPHILRGSDVVGIANTGTGKTAAFLIPLMHLMLKDRFSRMLVVVPTRELAIQIEEEYRGFARGLQMYSVCCVGGASIGFQIRELRRAPRVVIGTPGRLKDLIERKVLDLSLFRTAVLDEADRMLDMGFIGDMRFILSHMQKDRHTLFFSATLSREIEKLIGDFLRDPVRISVKTQDTPKNVEQDVVRVPEGKEKIDILHDLLIQPEFSKVLIFGQTKHGVEKLAKTLVARGFRAESIHGNKTHGRRQSALKLFRQNHVQILVATDVAARGLDIDGVSHVINYDIPATYDDYVHRIGRTGRGEKSGKALTFIEHRHARKSAYVPRQTHWRRS